MKKLSFALSLIAAFVLTGCNTMEEKRAEKAISAYYDAIIDEDYETAFKELFLYDGHITNATSLSTSEAKEIYFDKIKYLDSQNYKMKAYTIREIEYEDGHSFWHHIDIEIVKDGKTIHKEETAFYQNGMLSISGDDPFITYRDGKMDVDMES